MNNRAISIAETAEALGVSRPTVYKMIKDGNFPALRLRRRIVIPVEALNEWVKTQSQSGFGATGQC